MLALGCAALHPMSMELQRNAANGIDQVGKSTLSFIVVSSITQSFAIGRELLPEAG